MFSIIHQFAELTDSQKEGTVTSAAWHLCLVYTSYLEADSQPWFKASCKIVKGTTLKKHVEPLETFGKWPTNVVNCHKTISTGLQKKSRCQTLLPLCVFTVKSQLTSLLNQGKYSLKRKLCLQEKPHMRRQRAHFSDAFFLTDCLQKYHARTARAVRKSVPE